MQILYSFSKSKIRQEYIRLCLSGLKLCRLQPEIEVMEKLIAYFYAIIGVVKRKKIIRIVFWGMVLSALSFFYFLGLFNFGKNYREAHKDAPSTEKIDTVLISGWKFHFGDNPNWASPNFNDSSWVTIRLDSMPSRYNGQPAWFRLHLKVDPVYFKKAHTLVMDQYGASEIYFDGEKITDFGKVAGGKTEEENIDPGSLPLNIQLHNITTHCIAIHYSCQNFPFYQKAYNFEFNKFSAGFKLRIEDDELSQRHILAHGQTLIIELFLGIFLITLSLLHFLFFIFYRKAEENLFYSLFTFCYSMVFILVPQITTQPSLELFFSAANSLFLRIILPLSLLLFVNRVFKSHFPKWLWPLFIVAGLISVLDIFTDWMNPVVAYAALWWLAMGTIITMVISTVIAILRKAPGGRILGVGISIFSLVIFIIISIIFFDGGNISITVSGIPEIIIAVISLLSIPISMSIYLAYNFSLTNKDLSHKLIQVEELSAKTIIQEKEKQEILLQQKEKLEIQVIERTKEISKQKEVIEKQKQIVEEKNKDIVDSITYAKRLQDAILPPLSLIKHFLPESFVLYKPKDIVAGDFYWMEHAEDTILIAAADCTGHGVPGALVSVVCSNALNRAVKEFQLTDPGSILDKVRELVLETFEKSESNVQDGMDISLCFINTKTIEAQWSGAYNSLWYIRNGELKELAADKQPIGKSDKPVPFNTHKLTLQKGDILYLFTDGYADQFGGPKGKKFKYKQLHKLLLANANKQLEEQKDILESTLEKWKGQLEQVDDILVIGIKVL